MRCVPVKHADDSRSPKRSSGRFWSMNTWLWSSNLLSHPIWPPCDFFLFSRTTSQLEGTVSRMPLKIKRKYAGRPKRDCRVNSSGASTRGKNLGTGAKSRNGTMTTSTVVSTFQYRVSPGNSFWLRPGILWLMFRIENAL